VSAETGSNVPWGKICSPRIPVDEQILLVALAVAHPAAARAIIFAQLPLVLCDENQDQSTDNSGDDKSCKILARRQGRRARWRGTAEESCVGVVTFGIAQLIRVLAGADATFFLGRGTQLRRCLGGVRAEGVKLGPACGAFVVAEEVSFVFLAVVLRELTGNLFIFDAGVALRSALHLLGFANCLKERQALCVVMRCGGAVTQPHLIIHGGRLRQANRGHQQRSGGGGNRREIRHAPPMSRARTEVADACPALRLP
jgi:hypothetical protein